MPPGPSRVSAEPSPANARKGAAPKVFINYRHQDSEEAAVRLYERLAAQFGEENVFLDVKTLQAGTKWLAEIKAHGMDGGAFIALIGQGWLAALEKRKQVAPGDEQDYVEVELELALHRWPGKVIPVLVGRATMPPAVTLPKPIRALAGIEALPLRPLSFEEDLDRLIAAIGTTAGEPGASLPQTPNGSPRAPKARAPRTARKLSHAPGKAKAVPAPESPGEAEAAPPNAPAEAEAVPAPESPGEAEAIPANASGEAGAAPAPQAPGEAEAVPAPHAPGKAEAVPAPHAPGKAEAVPAPQAPGEAEAVPAPDGSHYECVLGKMVREGSIVPVLGSGVRGALPDADLLAAHLVEKFRLGLASPDLAEVAQHVAVSEGESFLGRAIFEALTPQPDPQAVDRFLARFPGRLREAGEEERYQMIVTTNYDSSLEQAFDDAGEEYDLAVFLATGTDSAGTDKGRFLHVPWKDEPRVISEPARYRDFKIDRFDELERTLIVKVHGAAEGGEGDLRWDGNYVLTEDQYIDYLACDQVARLVPYQILNKLTGSHCLFLGYQMRDWSLRVFLKRVWQGRQLANTSWAVERRVDAWERDCWKGLNVEVLAAAPDDYANALDEMLTSWHAAPS